MKWFHSLQGRWPVRRQGRAKGRSTNGLERTHGFRPRVEWLEERACPSGVFYDFDIDPSRSVITVSGSIAGFPIVGQSASFDTLTTRLDGIISAELDANTIHFSGAGAIESMDLASSSGESIHVVPGPSGASSPSPADLAGTIEVGASQGFAAIRDLSFTVKNSGVFVDSSGTFAVSGLAYPFRSGGFDYSVPTPFGTKLGRLELESVFWRSSSNTAQVARLNTLGDSIELSFPVDFTIEEYLNLSSSVNQVDLRFQGTIVATASLARGDVRAESFEIVGGRFDWGSVVDVRYTIVNGGWLPVGPMSVDLRAFAGDFIAASDPVLATVVVPALSPRETYQGTIRLDLPAAPPVGLATPDFFKIGLWVDPANAVAEPDEFNNQVLGFGVDYVTIVDGVVFDPDHATALPFEKPPVVSPSGIYRSDVVWPGLLTLTAAAPSVPEDALSWIMLDSRGDVVLKHSGSAVMQEHVLGGTYFISVRSEESFPLPSASLQAKLTDFSRPLPGSKFEAHPSEFIVIDMNGDGTLDLVTGSTPGSVSVRLGLGDGTFGPGRYYHGVTRNLHVSDINGDGVYDLVSASGGGDQGTLSVRLGLGDGGLSSERRFVTGGYPYQLNVIDVNGDGFLDALTMNWREDFRIPGNLSVLLGTGDGNFTTERRFAIGSTPVQLSTIDMNGDGWLDLVTANLASGDLSVLLGVGDGSFYPERRIASGGYANNFVASDVNRDGKQDIVAIRPNGPALDSGVVSVLLGLGDGSFASRREFVIGGQSTELALEDLNGDGWLDVIVTNSISAVSVLLGLGNGDFGAERRVAVGCHPRELVVTDVNGDGWLDLITGGYSINFRSNNGVISVSLGLGDGSFAPERRISLRANPSNLSVTDVNKDGRRDVLATVGSDLMVLFGLGDGNFATEPRRAVGDRPVQLAVIDLDGDGRLDLITTNANQYPEYAGSLSVLLGLPDGTFAAERRFAINGDPRRLKVIDVNLDGRLDVLSVNSAKESYLPGSVSVLLGLGNGSFAPERIFAVGPEPGDLLVVDVNQDGRLDLVALNERYYGDVSVLLGLGNGSFGAERRFAVGIYPRNLAVADVNGDGRADLLITIRGDEPGSSSVCLLLGVGDGGFESSRQFAVGDYPTQLELVDVNADGWPDLITGNQGGSAFFGVPYFGLGTASVLLNRGDGTFAAERPLVAGMGLGQLSVGDVNGDGFVDIVTANAGSHDLAVFLGQGNGNFAIERHFATSTSPRLLKLIDVNGDGRLDLVTAAANAWYDSYPGSVSVFLGHGDGNFAAERRFEVGSGPSQLAVIDVNDDGRLDVITTNKFSGDLSVLVGDGNGYFHAAHPWTADTGLGGPTAILALTSGVNPITLALAESGELRMRLRATSQGQPPIVVNAGYPARAFCAWSNLDPLSDSIATVAALDRSGRTVSLYDIDASGNSVRRAGPALQSRASAIAAADLDDDGRMDLVVASEELSTASIFLGQEDGAFSPLTDIPVGASPYSIRIADIDGSGTLDVLVANRLSATVSVIENLGSTRFSVTTLDASIFGTEIQPDALGGAQVISWDETLQSLEGDFTNDGKLDLVAVNGANRSFVIHVADGRGGFVRLPAFVAVGAQPIGVQALDINVDGNLDLALLAIADGETEVLVFTGDGTGSFRRGEVLGMDAHAAAFLATDANHDGWADLLVSDRNGNIFALFNQGGSFRPVSDGEDGPAAAPISPPGPFFTSQFFLFVSNAGVTNLFPTALVTFARSPTESLGIRPLDVSESGALSRRSLTNNTVQAEAAAALARWVQWLEEPLEEAVESINARLGTRLSIGDAGRIGGGVFRILVAPNWSGVVQLLTALGGTRGNPEANGAVGQEEGTDVNAKSPSASTAPAKNDAAVDAALAPEDQPAEAGSSKNELGHEPNEPGFSALDDWDAKTWPATWADVSLGRAEVRPGRSELVGAGASTLDLARDLAREGSDLLFPFTLAGVCLAPLQRNGRTEGPASKRRHRPVLT